MDEGTKPRILVVDNNPTVGRQLRMLLEPMGYRVKVAQGVGPALAEDARSLAWGFRPHVAIVDLRLLDDYRDERSGLDMLRELPSARRILYSAYLQNDVIREAMRRYSACNVIGKEEPPQRLLDAIAEAAREVCARSSGVTIDAPEILSSERIVASLLGEGMDAPPDLARDVLVQLFPKSKSVRLEMLGSPGITSEPVTRGRTVVFKAWWDERKEPLVVKLAPANRIEAEGINYNQVIKGNLRGAYRASMEGEPVTFWDLGGCLYSFVGLARRDLPSFASFYQTQAEPDLILQPLRHFFGDVWGDLYRDQRPSNEPLYDAYARPLHLEDHLARQKVNEQVWNLPGLPISLPDPLAWTPAHKKDSASLGARQADTHGDLHGDNLFVDGEHAWVIDFERSGRGHVLRDFVELEIDILTRLAQFDEPFPEVGSQSRFFDFCLALAAPTEPAQQFVIPAHLLSDRGICKAARVVGELRKMALELAGFTDLREYYWGLLVDALFLVSMPLEGSIQEARARLYGSVLCSRLEYWGEGWPLMEFMATKRGMVQ